jgi:hypothetical protein
MAKNKAPKGTKPKGQKPARMKAANNVPRGIRTMLDLPAKQYADLIADPCNAKLTNTIWPGSEGCYVSRFESDFIAFSGATETAGVFVYVPGANTAWVSSGALVSDQATAGLALAGTSANPGFTFLQASAGSIRAVASCVQVTFPGTELNRSGIVGLGCMRAGDILRSVATSNGGQNQVISAADVRQLCQHTERMPSHMAEILWTPGGGDQSPLLLGQPGNTAAFIDECSSKNALVVSVSGFPISTGVRIRFVTVVEWSPKAAQGLVATVEPPRSANSLNDILRALPETRGRNWFINAWAKATPYLRAAGSVISYGAKTLGPALLAI